MAKNLAKMTDDELVAENQRLMALKDGIRDQQVAVNQELSSRAAQRRADELLDGMTPDQIRVVQGAAAAAVASRESEA